MMTAGEEMCVTLTPGIQCPHSVSKPVCQFDNWITNPAIMMKPVHILTEYVNVTMQKLIHLRCTACTDQ